MTRNRVWHVCVFFLTLSAFCGRASRGEVPPELTSDRVYSKSERSHWSFQPIVRHDIPRFSEPHDRLWVRTPIDAFILDKLKSVNLSPSPEAERRVLIRRLFYDLHGLPPTPEEIQEFLDDGRSDAFARLVDRLLSSPQYGERWGQHWLDLVRFAESEGYEYDRHLPEAWQYRDYVIAAFNSNKPFDRFIIEQLAGDELAEQLTTTAENNSLRIDESQREMLIAAGMNRIFPVRRNAGNSFVVFSRNEVLTEMADNVGSAFLGLTIACARCHDHMFDPIRQKDYYRLQNYFSATFSHDIVLADESAREHWKTQNDAIDSQVAEVKKLLDGATGDQKEQLAARIEELEDSRPAPLPAVFTVRNLADEQTTVQLLDRGDERKPIGEPLGLRVPGVFLPDGAEELSAKMRYPKTKLAEWLTDPQHPLTARVMVNRIWYYHFGRGIVATLNDFGLNGELPTHPELLDWLADEFIKSGWDINHMHRLILMSSTYRQSSVVKSSRDEKEQIDEENHLLWKFRRRRLEAEEIRDSLLVISGRLNHSAGGPSVIVPVEDDLVNLLYKPSQWAVTPDRSEHDRRSIYLMAKRNLRLPFMEVFDQPDFQTSCPSRVSSTHSRQALELLNGPLANDLARSFAERLQAECGQTPSAQIERAFQLSIGRSPTSEESLAAQRFLEASSLKEFALAMFNINAFMYVD